MSLGIAYKGPKGIVLAADSRVTVMGTQPDGTKIPSTFDNATKLLQIRGQDFVGVVTYGQGALGASQPRTAHSYIPELEQVLTDRGRISVEAVAGEVSEFFKAKWDAAAMPTGADSMIFLVGGYDEGDTYGRVFQFDIPKAIKPVEQSVHDFGLSFGGQAELVARLLVGFDPSLIETARKALTLSANQVGTLQASLKALQLSIPMQLLPLQDAVDLVIFLIQTTASLQKWTLGVRGVGGPIDVATITRTDGFSALQRKQLRGNSVVVHH
jgi:20S proteasome alpha/beta subunit